MPDRKDGAAESAPDTTKILEQFKEGEAAADRRLKGVAYWVAFAFGGVGILVNINQIWNLHALGIVLVDTAYLFILLGLFMSLAFLAFPAKDSQRDRIPWFDWVLFIAVAGACFYLSSNGSRIVLQGWDLIAPPLATWLGAFLVLAALETVRRAGGDVAFCNLCEFRVFPTLFRGFAGLSLGPKHQR